MNEFDHLKNILETQFATFIRNHSYLEAFEQSIQLLDELIVKQDLNSDIDKFHLFLHTLVMELFRRIDSLHTRIDQLEESR